MNRCFLTSTLTDLGGAIVATDKRRGNLCGWNRGFFRRAQIADFQNALGFIDLDRHKGAKGKHQGNATYHHIVWFYISVDDVAFLEMVQRGK